MAEKKAGRMMAKSREGRVIVRPRGDSDARPGLTPPGPQSHRRRRLLPRHRHHPCLATVFCDDLADDSTDDLTDDVTEDPTDRRRDRRFG